MTVVGKLKSEIALPSINIWMSEENVWYDYFSISYSQGDILDNFNCLCEHLFADTVHSLIHISSVGMAILSYSFTIASEWTEIM